MFFQRFLCLLCILILHLFLVLLYLLVYLHQQLLSVLSFLLHLIYILVYRLHRPLLRRSSQIHIHQYLQHHQLHYILLDLLHISQFHLFLQVSVYLFYLYTHYLPHFLSFPLDLYRISQH